MRHGLVGRDAELGVLEGVLTDGAASAGRLVVLEGEAGAGKSRLVEAAAARARELGFQVFRARGAMLEEDLPFGIVRQLFERPLAELPPAAREDLLAGAAQLAGPLVDVSRTPGVPGPDTHGLLHGLYWLTAGLCRTGPLLLTVDDVQWADASSGRWLDHLTRRLDGLPLVVVLARRPARTPARWPGAAAEDPGGTCRLVLGGLDVASVGVLVRAALGDRATPSVVAACATQTAGNPFLLRELLAALPSGALDVPIVRACGPERLAQAVSARMAAAGPGASALADAVAVLGDGVELRLAARLAGIGVRQAEFAADTLADVGVLAPGRPLAYVHAIVRQALHGRRPAGERALAHAAAARLLAREDAPVEQVAAHLVRTDPAGSRWAVDQLRAAARRALDQGAPDSAVSYLRRALREPPHQRYDVLLELGRAEARVHHPDAEDHLEAVFARARAPERRATAALELARLLLAAGRPGRATDVLDCAVIGLEGARPEFALVLECERMAAAMGSLCRATGSVERFEAVVARAAPVDPSQGRLLMALRAVGWLAMGDDRAGSLALARSALAGGRLLAEQGCDSMAYYFACNAVAGCDELAEGCAALSAAVEEAQRRGSQHGYGFASAWRSWALLRSGDIGGAELDASVVDQWEGEAGHGFNQAVAASVLAEVQLERDDVSGARATVTRAWAQCQDDQVTNVYLRFVDARLQLLSGDPRSALEQAWAAGQQARTTGYPFPSLLPWRSTAALAHGALGHEDVAWDLVTEEVELTRRFGAPRALGMALRAQALTGPLADRVDVLWEAVAVLEASQARLEHARTLLELGAALRRVGHREDARRPLREALDLANRCGAVREARRASEELVVTGARPRRPALSGLDALTPAEMRVARCAAQDLTTREIAQRLFVTTKTVETHLTRTYRKLGITSRPELRDVFARCAVA